MSIALLAFMTAFVAALMLTVVVQPLARSIGAVDKPDQFRKIHQREIPRLGGVAVFLAFLAALLLLLVIRPGASLWAEWARWTGLLAATLVVLLMGIVDDIREMRARWKLTWQLVAAAGACLAGYTMREVSIPFLGSLQLGALSVPVTMLWFVGCTNAINLIDGLDGLAAGLSLLVCLTVMVVSIMLDHLSILLVASCLSGAILGFLVHNFHPATIFLGDSGSQMLGFLIAALWVGCTSAEEPPVALLVPVMALGIPFLDTGVAILRRWSHRLPLFAPDRHHIHHALLSLGISHPSVVLILYVACALLCATAVLSLHDGRDEVLALVLLVLALIAIVFIRSLGMLQVKKLVRRVCQDWTQHKDLNAAKVEVVKMVHRIQYARNLQEAWQMSENVFKSLRLDVAVLGLPTVPSSAPEVLFWHAEGVPATAQVTDSFWYEKLPLKRNGSELGSLEVGIILTEGRSVIPEMTELLGELQRSFSNNLVRLREGCREDAGPDSAAGKAEGPGSARTVSRLCEQFVCLRQDAGPES